ncbi:hypothetical protein OHO28_29580 [Streptomyces europaeiscabiei]|uniref:hypothetical protein n=1 Tax=Streptomyces europaeiscabiei TaxID=146819 RepID=UPI002E19EF9C
MQVEVISALIAAAVAIPAAGVAYAIGRHQAAATISAARTQAAAGQKQWRDNNRHSTWLLFIRAADKLDIDIAAMGRGDRFYDSEFGSAMSELHNKLADVEFEGPSEIFKLAQRIDRILNLRLYLSAFITTYMAAQRKFDRALAEAQREIASIDSGEAPAGPLRIIEANQALESLSGQRAAAAAASPPDDLMETAMMLFAPLIQSAGREFREPVTLMSQGVAQIVLSAAVAAPAHFSEAERKLRECEAFEPWEIEKLFVNYISGMIPIFEQTLNRSRATFLDARKSFVHETGMHLDAHPSVPR